MIRADVVQGSQDWFDLKCGVPSASNFDKIVTSTGEVSKQRKAYMYRLVGERITKSCEETYQSDAMARGVELEEEAVKLYELITDTKCEKVGVTYYDEKKSFLASPDRLITGNNKGIIEIKCPNMANHIEYLVNKKLPTKYFQQIQGQLLCTDAEWCDFISYYPAIRPLIIRVKRDNAFIETLKTELVRFSVELGELENKLKEE